ncbi:MAG TPA: class I SAM-dependent methyltransferase [Candidatus Paceibacterota bacterium]|nr:class I SAM-dependent methyltransferase [Verrucomicrobiota bacterium]HSA11888.1 class I SAM-dependent methyltransferase [Candidatus Paceibacterota bacterium]
MFERFPKKRPPLPKEIEEIYAAHYRSNRQGQTTASSLAQKLESWMHKKVAADVARRPASPPATLEIGAGTLNQLKYEPPLGPYDIIEPFTSLYAGSPLLGRIRNIYADISEVPDDSRYDRITSVATFEHVLNLPNVVGKAGLLLRDNGVLRIAIPSEGTFLWTMGWKLTTGLEFRLKRGLDYGLLMKHEHVNDAREIAEILEFFFDKVETSFFGLARSVSLYQFYVCSSARLAKCREYGGHPDAPVGAV